MKMNHFNLVFIAIGLCAQCRCEDTNSSDSWPEERGLILSTLNRDDNQHAVIRHIPIYPGFESFEGGIPGVKITSAGNTHVFSIDVEFRSRRFYMYDYHLRSVLLGSGYHKELNSEIMDLYSMHIGASRGTIQLAVDWLSHTVYWTDAVFRWILAAPGQLEKLEEDYFKVIVNTHLDAPDGLALDPINGYLFWSDNGRHPKIERSDLMGQDRHTLVSRHLLSPLSMDADLVDRRIYWIDSYTEALMSSPYEGKVINLITRIPASTLFDLALFRDVVYVSDIRNANLYTLSKTTGQQRSTTLNISPETIYGIAVYGEESQPVNTRDYCEENSCDQICISQRNDSVCACSEGYEIDTVTGKCQESYGAFHRAIVIANSTHVCMLDIRSFAVTAYGLVCTFTVLPPPMSSTTVPSSTTSARPTAAPPVDDITVFDIDVERRLLFFATVNNKIFLRPIDLPIEDKAMEQVIQASGKISGLAYDTVYSENLYWCESDTGRIWLVDVDTGSPRRIFTDNDIENPNSIAVLPKLRKLAWISESGRTMSIQTMGMDGAGLQSVVSGLSDIASFVFDDEAQVFYVASRGTNNIYRADLDGTSTVVEEEDTIRTIFQLVHYNNYLGWIYRGPDGIILQTKILGQNVTVAHGELGHDSPVVGLKVLDTKPRLPEAASPCAYKNGGCSQICTTKYTGDIMEKVCECRLGYKLGRDRASCQTEVVFDNFILVSDWTNNVIQQIDLETNAINAVITGDNVVNMGIYFDINTGRIFWTEYQSSFIFSSNLDGTDHQAIANIGDSFPYRMDIDMTGGNLYYTSYNNQHIGVLTSSGINKWLKKDFTSELLGDIIVHPAKGWMYYTVYHTRSYVARANTDGTDEVIIIEGAGVVFPDGLAIDFKRDHLYWSDAAWDTIQRCNLDGKDCITVVNKTGTYQPEEIRDLFTDGVYLYYSAYRKDHVVRVNLADFNDTAIVGQNPGLGKLDTIALYSSTNENMQPINEFCKARDGLGDCSTICFPTKAGRACGCEEGISLKLDGKACSNVYQCSDIIRQKVLTKKFNREEEVDVIIDRTCLRHLNDNCSYHCPTFYAPVNTEDPYLTCTNVGWDRETVPLCKELVCSDSSLPNGRIIGNCSHRIGDECLFECDQGYRNTTDKVSCNNNLAWLPTNSCIEITVVTEAPPGLPIPGVVAGIVVLLLVIIALVIIIVFLVRRKRARKAADARHMSASFHHGQDGSIAIENPGYIPSESSTDVNKDEHPYSTVDPSYIKPVFTEGSKSDGHEPLPEVTSLEVTQDTTVLTYDSWLKERQKEMTDKY